MKVTVERAQLLKSLGHVHRVVERRNTIPILGNVLLRAENSRLSLKATDLDLEVTETLAAEVATGGSTTVPAHMLYDIVRKLPDGVADRAGGDRRPRRAGDPRRPLALYAADAARERFPGSRRRRDDAYVRARRRRREAADRPHAVRDLDRRDPLLPERHLPAQRRHGEGRDAARASPPTATGWRRSTSRCRRAPTACPA